MPPCEQQPRDVQAFWRKIGNDKCCRIKKAHSLDEPLLILGKYPSRYLVRSLSLNLFCFFPLFLPPSFSLSICKFFEKWESISEDADPYFPSSLGWMAWQDSALWGPNKPLPGMVPSISYALGAHRVIFIATFLVSPTPYGCFACWNSYAKESVKSEIYVSRQGPAWGRSDFNFNLPALTQIHCSLSTAWPQAASP